MNPGARTPFLRPQARAFLAHWGEFAAACLLAAAGLWFLSLGGYLFTPFGGAVILFAAAWAVMALRRMRFQRPVSAPGVVEVVEGQVGYLGPNFGGYVSLRELVEVRMIHLHKARQWRLKQSDGQTLLIPTTAQGASALFDAFASLPGADMAAFSNALDSSQDTLSVWRNPARAPLT